MGDLWQRIKDYLEPTGRWLSAPNDMSNTEFLLLLIFFSALWVAILYFTSRTHEERHVSRQNRRARHREMMDRANNAITEALEAKVEAGELDRKFVDERVYRKMRSAGFREIGPEPTFGKPWYAPWFNSTPHPAKVKRGIYTRLHSMGVDVLLKLNQLRRRKPANRMQELQAKLKLRKT